MERAFHERIAKAQRACKLCYTYKRTTFDRGERDRVVSSLKELIQMFNEEFNTLRKKDVPGELVQTALENKRICMDLLDKCKNCKKEADYVRYGLTGLKRS